MFQFVLIASNHICNANQWKTMSFFPGHHSDLTVTTPLCVLNELNLVCQYLMHYRGEQVEKSNNNLNFKLSNK